ncbi:MAG TPA: HAMP domain-containing protein [Clostridia bacterium]|nr:HAMP domain-containing protein [Clostridia bacterium]
MTRKGIMSWWHSIRFRLLAFGVLMSIVPLTALGYFNVQAAGRNLEHTISRQMEINVQRLAADLESLIGGELATVATLAKVVEPGLVSGSRDRQEGMLYTLLKEAPSLEDISLVDHRGVEIARASRRQVVGREYRHLGGMEPVKQLLAGNDAWSRTFIDSYGQVRLEKAVPIRQKETGVILGGFVAEISLRGVMHELTKRQPEHQGRVFVVNHRGQLVGHEDFSQVLAQRDVRPSLAVKEFLAGSQSPGENRARRYLGYDGVEVLGVWAPVPSLGWAVVQEMPVAQAFQPVHRLASRLALGGLALVAVVTSLSIFFGVRFSRSLEKLEKGVEEIRKGNLRHPIPVEGKDELTSLAETINRMREELLLRRQQEEALWQAEKLSSLGLLASGVAHEVNNPLGIMLAHAQDLKERLPEEGQALMESGELEEYLDTIIRQTKRCKEITGSLLSFAGYRQGGRVEVELGEALAATLKLLEFRLRKQGIQLGLSLPAGLPRVMVQKGELQQVFLNILTNAMDAMPHGGRLSIEGTVAGGELVLAVADEGVGIKEEDLRSVFDPFYTTKAPGQGTGLGLPISYSIMQRLGGKIRVESTFGRGTTVYLHFPLPEEGQDETGYPGS